MSVDAAEATEPDCRVIRPGFAVDWPQTVRIFVSMAVTPLLLGIAFAAMGYWPILPFAGLEVTALGVALYVSARRSLDREVLRRVGDRLYIEKGRGRPQRCWQFQLAWSEVVMRPGAGGQERVYVRSRGEAVELGEFLDEEARGRLAEELRAWIGPMGSAAGTADR